ncbi:xanthine dehydrogenase family protein molybdopterin-binding subunit [Dehalobacterium formicoaceticum]|uniref:xanthine dehydrogenase family protein molybdopterin-binding subunit n=1 Tax=Dehalobacterium formicoaceticum TaxID=51515 RepID=UPI001FA8265A|nr:molybdopterin cofactor-binding domain-containing protein [Dehalobacterium formicoaceticum]
MKDCTKGHMKIVGVSHPIHDAKAKVRGKATYAGDMELAGMQYAAMLLSPIPHALIKSIDPSEALALEGVETVLHCFNTTENLFSRWHILSRQPGIYNQERVFNRELRQIGDRVACVVADTPEIARQAVRLIKVEYEELPFTTDVHEVLKGALGDMHPEGAISEFEREMGDKSLVAQDCVETVTHSSLDRVSHTAMEPHACLAYYDQDMDELTIWSPNQGVFGIRSCIADLFEMQYHKVRVIKTTMGGSFGGKQDWILEPVAACATLATGKPVKLVYSREEVMLNTSCRCPYIAEVKSRFTRDGLLQSLDLDVISDAGAYLGNSVDYMMYQSVVLSRTFKFPYARYHGRAVCTNGPTSGGLRGWSSGELSLFVNHNINMAARKLGIDPLELCLKNVYKPGDIDHDNLSMGEIRTKECIELGREKFHWDEKKRADADFNRENKRYQRGVSISCGGHHNGYYPIVLDFTGVEMRFTESGSVIVNVALHDHGCGTVQAFKMIAAEALGLPVDMIHVAEGDTAYNPADTGCYASRTIYVIGRAVKDCCQKLQEQLLQDMAHALDMPVEDLEIVDAQVRAKNDPTICFSYTDAVHEILYTLSKEVWVKHEYNNTTNPGVTGTHFAHVEVDTWTGMIKILDYLAVHDIGKAINPEICRAQIQGAVLMGSGFALTETLHTNLKTGKSVSSLKDYHVINAWEAPQIQVLFVEDGLTEGPYGAKSIGEISFVPVTAAIVGAVNEALQSDFCECPLNPDKIVALMQERRAKA